MSNAANVLCQQIGNRAFTMFGAKNIVALEHGVQFKVGSNALKVTNLRITLQADDTYHVESFKIRGTSVAALAIRKNVYAEELCSVIEAMTGMYASL